MKYMGLGGLQFQQNAKQLRPLQKCEQYASDQCSSQHIYWLHKCQTTTCYLSACCHSRLWKMNRVFRIQDFVACMQKFQRRKGQMLYCRVLRVLKKCFKTFIMTTVMKIHPSCFIYGQVRLMLLNDTWSQFRTFSVMNHQDRHRAQGKWQPGDSRLSH